MNKRDMLIVIILFLIILCLLCLWVFKKQIFNYEELNNFSNESTNNEIINEDKSEKVAKLYKLPDNKYNNEQYVKDITKNVVDKIENMLETSESSFGDIEFINASDYLIKFDSSQNKNIEFRISNNYILVIVDSMTTYNIYNEIEVRLLLEILGAKLKDESKYTVIDINKMYTPPILYINNIYQAILISHIWKDERENILALDMNINIEELLKAKQFISSSFAPTISTNINITNNSLTMLPNTAKITYAIHKEKEIILTNEAERMINGSYHLDKPNVKGEYIYLINLTFTNLPNISAMYYFKYVV